MFVCQLLKCCYNNQLQSQLLMFVHFVGQLLSFLGQLPFFVGQIRILISCNGPWIFKRNYFPNQNGQPHIIYIYVYIYMCVYIYIYIFFFFPTCQVRVVRFYQSCSPPPRLAVLLLLLLVLPLLLLQFLLDHVCINFHLHFHLANSWPSSLPTLFAKLFANFPAQCAPLDLTLGPAQLSVHRWTSTWDLPSSVCTAGPHPGTCPAQCAPLDLNRGPSQLSVHRWTSTGDLPSSVCTAGPQRPDRMPEDMS